jgi:hypothetical protein
MKKLFTLSILLLVLAAGSFAQLTTTSTNFSVAVAATGPGTAGNTNVQLASCTGTVLPSVSQVGSYLWADAEAMQIAALVSGTIGGSGTCTLNVVRGVMGTLEGPHATSAVVYIGNQATSTGDPSRPASGGPFIGFDPEGSCTAAQQYTLPLINWRSGRVWTCPTTGPLANLWAVTYDPTAIFSLTDGALFVPPGACSISASGNSTGTVGLQTVGGVAVQQQAVTSTGTNTITLTCHMSIPTRLRGSTSGPGAGAAILDVVVPYGVQQASLGTQVATLASGTMNSTAVFQKSTFPVAAASETQSAAFARADTGTLLITPVVASFNTGTTTAGQFFTVKFTPATPILMNTDLQDITVNVTFQCAATTATTVNSPGMFVHIIGVPL